ncbi:hypothetical protein B0H10DRAFT_1953407 [Mycena sp. CBHHK59/15]|nr:hypothetical protein B0H10DRAFT_1953407 [Mycena sp. CBHHK59/15]
MAPFCPPYAAGLALTIPSLSIHPYATSLATGAPGCCTIAASVVQASGLRSGLGLGPPILVFGLSDRLGLGIGGGNRGSREMTPSSMFSGENEDDQPSRAPEPEIDPDNRNRTGVKKSAFLASTTAQKGVQLSGEEPKRRARMAKKSNRQLTGSPGVNQRWTGDEPEDR